MIQISLFVNESEAGLVIAVQDNGKGVVPEIKEKIFNRGFGSNTGLGLYLSKEILDITGISIRETGMPGSVHGLRFSCQKRVPPRRDPKG